MVLGWVIGLSMFLITNYVPALDDCLHVAVFAARCDWGTAAKVFYDALFRPMWGIWICWLIFACTSGYAGMVESRFQFHCNVMLLSACNYMLLYAFCALL